MSVALYAALLHYPVHDKNGRIVATAVTNVDVHDLSRQAATYGLAGLFLVTPVAQQRTLIGEMVDHWTRGAGGSYNPRRKEAIGWARIVAELDEAIRMVTAEQGVRPLLIGTSASRGEGAISCRTMRRLLEQREGSAILVFGTGWGLERSFLERFDYMLEPLRGPVAYNHLSVRSAAAIIIDRLKGRQDDEVE